MAICSLQSTYFQIVSERNIHQINHVLLLSVKIRQQNLILRILFAILSLPCILTIGYVYFCLLIDRLPKVGHHMCIVHRIYLQINFTYLTALIIHYFFEKVVQDFSVKFYLLLVVLCFRNVNRCFLCTTLLKHSIILLILATIIYFCVAEIRE